MDEPLDLEARLAAMAGRRVAANDRPAGLTDASRRRIRRGQRIGAAVATLLVVALLAGGVALARSGRQPATTVRVGQATGAPQCDPPDLPPGLADQVRALARLGIRVPGETPRALVVHGPTTPAPATPSTSADRSANTVPTPAAAWEVVISGEHFVPEFVPPGYTDPSPHMASSESWDLDANLGVIGSAIPGPSASQLAAAGPATAVALDNGCVPSSSSTTTLGLGLRTSTSSTETPVTTPSTLPAAGTAPACVGSHVSVDATTDHAAYAPGQTVTITVTIRNPGAPCQNSSKADPIDSCPLLRVTDPSGHTVYDPGVFCPLPLTMAVVPSGYHRGTTFTWKVGQGADTCTGASCDGGVATGTYTITPANPEIAGIQVHATTIRIT